MSRTIRRKGKAPYWYTSKCVRIHPKSFNYKWVPLEGKELKKSINKYHGDTGKGYGWNGNAPADFRRMMSREFRSKCKHEMRRINSQGDYEEYSFDPFEKNAGWYYW